MRKILISFLLLFTLIIGCSNQEESILKEATSEEETNEKSSENRIVFGEKTGDKDLDARNVFKLGEPTHFVVYSDEALDVSEVTVVLKKHKGEDWEQLTKGQLDVKPEWKQFMNGLPASLYEQTGPGAYKLEVIKGEDVLAEGDFIIEKNDQEQQS